MNPEEFTRFVYWLTIIMWILAGMTVCSGVFWGLLAFVEWIKDIIDERRNKYG